MDTQTAVKQDTHYTVYDDDWNGYTKCGLLILSGVTVSTSQAAVTCPWCLPG